MMRTAQPKGITEKVKDRMPTMQGLKRASELAVVFTTLTSGALLAAAPAEAAEVGGHVGGDGKRSNGEHPATHRENAHNRGDRSADNRNDRKADKRAKERNAEERQTLVDIYKNYEQLKNGDSGSPVM